MNATRPLLLIPFISLPALAQDNSPLKDYHVWLPMTGATDRQMDDAVAAGFNAVMLKIHPPPTGDGEAVDFTGTDKRVGRATQRGFKLVLAILGWAGLGDGRFWDVDENGRRIPNRLDPFWPEAMQRVEWYFARVIDHYQSHPHVVAFAPTWGIYGEAGFTSLAAGRSGHARARFNEWRQTAGLPRLRALPTRRAGPNTEFNRFVRFRYLYLERQFDAMIRRLKRRVGDIPVGMWQGMYPVSGYLWTVVEVPAADFAPYESCFPFQTSHHPARTLAETMGFRYRCGSADDYRHYYLPLLARKRGEGQRFMGCQLSNDYAVRNYGWSQEKARRVGFDQWEDTFSPYLKKLLDAPLEAPQRDVLLVFPTYAAAALSDRASHAVDCMLIDVLLRMHGCQMVRVGSAGFDKLTVAEMNRFRLIVVPCAAYLTAETYAKLKRTTATVLFAGCFGQSFDAQWTPFGQERVIDGTTLRYVRRRGGNMTADSDHPLTKNLVCGPIFLPEDESFDYARAGGDEEVLARCGDHVLLSTRNQGRFIFIHGHLLAGLAYDPDRRPPEGISGSADPSANEHDPWGPHSSTSPHNAVGRTLINNILDHAGVDYRVVEPKPRRLTPYLGDHMEPASVSANIAYNNTAEAQTLTVRLPYRPKGYNAKTVGSRFETEITIDAFSYVALQPAGSAE